MKINVKSRKKLWPFSFRNSAQTGFSYWISGSLDFFVTFFIKFSEIEYYQSGKVTFV
jgi:hypothetical protein